MTALADNVLAAPALRNQSLARAQATGCAVLVKVVVPISTGTIDEAVDQIRGGVDGSRNTLAKLSAALDAQGAPNLSAARRSAVISALVFG